MYCVIISTHASLAGRVSLAGRYVFFEPAHKPEKSLEWIKHNVTKESQRDTGTNQVERKKGNVYTTVCTNVSI